MDAPSRFHYLVVASREDGGESRSAGAVSSSAIPGLIAQFRLLGLTQVHIIETAAAIRARPDTLAAE